MSEMTKAVAMASNHSSLSSPFLRSSTLEKGGSVRQKYSTYHFPSKEKLTRYLNPWALVSSRKVLSVTGIFAFVIFVPVTFLPFKL